MYCRKCGKELPDDALFCKYCGEKIKIQDYSNCANKLPKTDKLDVVSKVGVKGIAVLCLIVFVIVACINAINYYGWPFSNHLKEVNIEGFNASLSMLSPIEMKDERMFNPGPDIKRYIYKTGKDEKYICEVLEIEHINSHGEYSDTDVLISLVQDMKKTTSNLLSGKYEKVSIGKLNGTKVNVTYTVGKDKYNAQYLAFHKNNDIWCVNIGYKASNKDGEMISEKVVESIKITPKQ